MQQRAQKRHSRGQALVEFALLSILLVLILGMAIDGGLMYLTYQNMVNAVEEGLSYGSLEPNLRNGSGVRSNNDAAIRFRMRHEGGDRGAGDAGIRYINLFDLNNDGTLDDAQGGYAGGVLASYIAITSHTDSSGTTACANRSQNCWLRIDMRYDYQVNFPILPFFGNTFEMHVVRTQQITRQT